MRTLDHHAARAALSSFLRELNEAERRGTAPIYLLDQAGTLTSIVPAELLDEASKLVDRALALKAKRDGR